MRLGLFGGSFNPIHHGHLITATRAAEAVQLDRVLFIPTAISPLKAARALAFLEPGISSNVRRIVWLNSRGRDRPQRNFRLIESR